MILESKDPWWVDEDTLWQTKCSFTNASEANRTLSFMDKEFRRRTLPWFGLCCILVVYFFSVLRFNPLDLFGTTQDDSLYFSSAKAIANQQGYILPSVPGGPVATKYPILYPWILSWVWRWNPSFPSNLRAAVALTAAFGVVFLVSTFVFLRRLKGIGDSTALLITFFTALHPVVLYYSANVLSDIPFAALAFTAMVVADQAMRPNASAVPMKLSTELNPAPTWNVPVGRSPTSK